MLNNNIISYEDSLQKNLLIYEIYTNEDYFIKLIKMMYNIKDRRLTLKEIKEIFNFYETTIKNKIEKLNLLDYFIIRSSDLELQFAILLDNNNISFNRDKRVIRDDNDTILEMDFILDSLSLAFEINDTCTHNINKRNSTYHITKTIKAKEQQNIRLIHIWEWELKDPKLWNRLSNWILDLCNTNKTIINGKDCNIQLVPINEEKEFLNNYHLQGYKKSEVCIGLYYKNELVQIMSFGKPRYNSSYEYELLRLCTKYGYVIDVGSEFLLNYFIRKYFPKSIISYCNLDKFTGDIYEKLKFKLLQYNQPSAIWYNPITEDRFLNSSLVMRGADKLIGTNYGKGTDNEEIVEVAGYKKVYNCGINVYSLIL